MNPAIRNHILGIHGDITDEGMKKTPDIKWFPNFFRQLS